MNTTSLEATTAPETAGHQSLMPRPSRRFDVIYADPPWDVLQKGSYGADKHYDLMTLDQIKSMGPAIRELAADDAHCYLWVTNATLRDGYDVLEAWGFTPRTGPLTWVKPRLGLGQYLRNATEHLLFGTRGKAPVKYRSQPTWAFWPLLDHSTKPDEVYAVIDRLSGRDTPKLELFARREPPFPNWSVWGDEIKSDVSLSHHGYWVPSDFVPPEPDSAVASGSDPISEG